MNVRFPLSAFRFPLIKLIRSLILAAGHAFYPRITLLGELPAGGLILAANHPNGLLDGLVLLLALQQPIAFLAKSTFFANPLIAPVLRAFDAVPVYRPGDRRRSDGLQRDITNANQATFAAAHTILRNGGRLAIFPEGTPNPSPVLLPLKTGVARIALETEAGAEWSVGVQIVPIGLWFEAQSRPQTAALVYIGKPIALTQWQQVYEADPQAAVRALTAELRVQLEAAVGAAALAGQQRLAYPEHWQAKRPAPNRWVRMLLAPLALLGYLLVIPGLLFGRAIHWLLTRRHRANVGTAQLVATMLGLVLGWLGLGFLLGWFGGVWVGVAGVIAALALGWLSLWLKS